MEDEIGRAEMKMHTKFWSKNCAIPREKSKQIWEDNIKMHLRETGWGSLYWMHLDQNRDQMRALVNTVMNH
jgi:hypothetical protein